MTIEAEVLSIDLESFTGKYGHKTQLVICCLDKCTNCRFKDTVDYILSELDQENYPAIKTDHRITLGINRITPGFGGRPRMYGTILEYNGNS